MYISYRKLSNKDCPDLINLWIRAKLPSKPNGRDSRQNLEKQMMLSRNSFLGAYQIEKLVGAVIASHNGRKGWINRLAVDPEVQNNGIASRLITLCEEFFHKEEIKIFACLIENWNVKSETLFLKKGYAKYKEVSYFTKRIDPEV